MVLYLLSVQRRGVCSANWFTLRIACTRRRRTVGRLWHVGHRGLGQIRNNNYRVLQKLQVSITSKQPPVLHGTFILYFTKLCPSNFITWHNITGTYYENYCDEVLVSRFRPYISYHDTNHNVFFCQYFFFRFLFPAPPYSRPTVRRAARVTLIMITLRVLVGVVNAIVNAIQ